MKRLLPFLLLTLFLYNSVIAQITPNASGVVFVKKGGTGNGSSWANAVGELADAMKAANADNSITEIWVAAGTYHPLYKYPDDQAATPNDPDNTFSITRGYKVFGHFAGNESSIAERRLYDPAFKTSMSGDFANNNAVSSTPDFINWAGIQENSHIVLTIVNKPFIFVYELNGLTITGGYNNSGSYPGAGIKAGGNVTGILRNLEITENLSTGKGSAVYIEGGSLIMTNCIIRNNQSPATENAGIYLGTGSTAHIFNTVFTRNFAAGGNALFVDQAYAKLINCTLVENGISNSGTITANGPVGFIHCLNSIIMQTFQGTGDWPKLLQGSMRYFVQNCIVESNSFNGSSIANFQNIDPQFVGTSALPDFKLNARSNAVNAGNNLNYVSLAGQTNIATDKDLAGNPRLKLGSVDIGAFETQKYWQEISYNGSSVTYGDDFEIPATASSGLPVIISSANSYIAEPYLASGKWMMKARNAGTVKFEIFQAGNDDYEPVTKEVTMEVTKRTVTVTPIERTKTYGDTDPNIGWTFSGTVNNDVVYGNTVREPGENVGQYKILPGTLNGGPNYTIELVPTVFRITPRAMYVTVEFKQKFYGQPDPAYTMDVTGLANISDYPTGSISREPGEDAGEYDFNKGTLSAGSNYTMIFFSNKLVIHKSELIVSIGSYSRPFGEPDPAIELQYYGFANNDGPEDIVPPAILVDADLNSPPGFYNILLTGGSSNNYNFNLVPLGSLQITGARVNIQQQPVDRSVCMGNSTTMSVGATPVSPIVQLQYQWEYSSDGNNWQLILGEQNSTLTNVSKDGYYRSMIIAPGTLFRTDIARLIVNKAAIPVITIAGKICLNEGSLALKASPGGGVFSGPGISNNTWNLEIPDAGKQTIHYSYTDANGCTGEASKTIELQPCVSEADGISLLKAIIYPNPSAGPVTLRLLVGVGDDWYLGITGMNGQLVQQRKLSLRQGWNTISVDISTEPAGIYSISLGRGGRWKKAINIIKR